MADLITLRKMLAQKVSEAKALALPFAKEAAMPQETADKISGILGETDGIKAQINLMEQLENYDQYMAEPAGTKAAHLGWREAAPGEGMPEVDPKAWHELKVAHPMTGKEMIVRYQVPLASQKKGYSDAFEIYTRKGFDYMGPEDRKTLTEGVDSAGGYTVPMDVQASMIRKIATTALIRSMATVISTSRDIAKWIKLKYTTDDKYTSGVRLTWTGEIPTSATVHRVTEPVLGALQIPVHTAMASMPLSNDLLEDSSFDIMGLGSELMGEAFGLGEDDVFVNGDGVGKPFGLVTRVTVGDDPIGTVVSGSASALTADGLIDLFFGLPAQYRSRAAFILNSGSAKTIRKFKDATNNRYLWDSMNGGLMSPGINDYLLSKPVLFDEFMPDQGSNTYPVLFGDVSGYMVVDRVGLSIQRLAELYAETNITLLLARRRVGGDVAYPFRMKFQKCST